MPKHKNLKIKMTPALLGQIKAAYQALKRSKARPAPETHLLADLVLQLEESMLVHLTDFSADKARSELAAAEQVMPRAEDPSGHGG